MDEDDAKKSQQLLYVLKLYTLLVYEFGTYVFGWLKPKGVPIVLWYQD